MNIINAAKKGERRRKNELETSTAEEAKYNVKQKAEFSKCCRKIKSSRIVANVFFHCTRGNKLVWRINGCRK